MLSGVRDPSVQQRDSQIAGDIHSEDLLRIGVIGVGNMWQHHARVLSRIKDVQLVGSAWVIYSV